MNRRQTLALAFAGLAAGPGCKSRQRDGEGREEAGAVEPGAPGGGSRELEGQTLVPAQVDPGLEIRTVAGLRPFRPSGFVLRREEREGKILVHNYGHGGGGISLSWGCAHLALELAGPVAGKSCAVLGGGVMGLSTALLLRRRGAEVTLYSRELPPETTSNLAGAQWWPVSVFDAHLRTEAFAAQFVAAANISHRAFQDLVGARWGVRWVPNYYLSDDEPANGWMGGPGGVLHHLQVGFRDFGPGEHIFPARFVRRFHTMLIEPAAYLATLLRDVQIAGARIEIRHFANAQEALRLPQALLFNCSGLGARELFGDEQLIPVKGQLTVLLPQPEVRYNLISNHYYMFPRSDGIVLGGTYERGQSDTTPDPAARLRILDAHRALFDGMAQYQGVSR